MSELPTRKRTRLEGYDYSSAGYYFITFCAKDKHELLGKVVVGRDALGAPFVQLSEYGGIVSREINETPSYYDNIIIDKFIVLPNHVHMIIAVTSVNGAPRASRPTNSITPQIVTIIKRKTNKEIGFNLWQTSYHDHIIRNEEEYLKIWQYIDTNPSKWAEDCYHTQ